MLLAIVVYALFPAKGILWGILSRVIAIPIIAGLSFELLRLGARFTDSAVMRVLMAPGLWLQKITTKPPDHGPDRGRHRVVPGGAPRGGRGRRRSRHSLEPAGRRPFLTGPAIRTRR